ncbi:MULTISPECIES: glycosyltransferase family 1 protein [unclassified Pseudovibrio]|uniref:glycosyltransferase family 4 protein n=1 Tax=unclassified Pseudovibrio TaxID=2627060 RepID=UPI0007B1F72D|nr:MULTISPECIES: glycosyltransferase family 1 protein [unclassified Pseudovibrio]KZK94553.1 D-inositol-3-phosphate glycosyltransferase [Pseudovibrio sp. W74]KZL06952.1 D-inositol-3-phosphate glycosyltransferase [Pseudovibrio sp. Ad14]
MTTPKPKLYFDLTTLRQNRSTSLQANGVIRTLYETARRFYKDDLEVIFICHDARTNEYVSVQADPLFKDDDLNPAYLPDLLGAPVKTFHLEKYRNRKIKGLFHRLRHTLRSHADETIGAYDGEALGDPLSDIDAPFLSLGNLEEARRLTEYVKSRAPYVPVYVMIHDISPLRLNDLEEDLGAKLWLEHLRRTVTTRPHVLANSEYTRSDLLKFLAEQKLPSPQSTSVVHLAHEFQETEPIYPLRQRPENGFFLLLGDIRYRKNAKLVFDAYLHILEHNEDTPLPQLICAGAIPNGAFASLNKDQQYTAIGKYVTIVQSPSQAELTALYKEAIALVYPSLFEGYGLPVGEALWMGTPVLASKATSIPEVGGDHCRYFDPHNAEELAALIQSTLKTKDTLRAELPLRAELRQWQNVKEDIWQAIQSHSTSPDKRSSGSESISQKLEET